MATELKYPALSACLEEVLREVDQHNDDELHHEVEDSQYHASLDTTRAQLSLEIIHQACDRLSANKSLPSEVQHVCQVTNRCELLQKMQFLNECLVPKGCFTSSAKEKAWSKFYAALADEHFIGELSSTVPPEVASLICFEVFDILLKAYDVKSALLPVDSTVQESEKDIVTYIGGALLQKLKKRAYRLQDRSNHENILMCIDRMCTQEAEPGTLTAVLDRGGLLKLTRTSQDIFFQMETVFRSTFSGFNKASMSFTEYFKACTNESFFTMFYQQMYSVEVQDAVKEKFLKDLVFLYFKTRAHHKCKMFMDDFSRQSQLAKREKGLRTRLKKGLQAKQ